MIKIFVTAIYFMLKLDENSDDKSESTYKCFLNESEQLIDCGEKQTYFRGT